MSTHFSAEAKRAIKLSLYEASKFELEIVEPELLLLGLLRERSPDILHLLTAEQIVEIRRAIEAGMPRAISRVGSTADLPFSEDSKYVLGLAKQIAKDITMIHTVYPSHILLCILGLGEGNASSAMSEQGLIFDNLLRELAAYWTDELKNREMVDKIASLRSPRVFSRDLLVVWNPEALSPHDYASLIVALGNLVRASGGKGLKRIDPIAVEVESPARIFA